MIIHTEHEEVCLEGVLSFLQQVIPISYIFSLYRTPTRLDLIIVLDKLRYKPMEEIQSIINFSLMGYKNITCTIHAYATMKDMLQRGHIFHSLACVPSNCVYSSEEDFSLPSLCTEQCSLMIGQATDLFSQCIQKATNFYNGALFFLAQQETKMAAFMLQQTCELTLRGLLLSLTKKDIRCHDLTVLHKKLAYYLPDIVSVFYFDEKKEQKLLALLDNAYIKSRYDNSYEIDIETLAILMPATQQLLEQSKRIFEHRITKLASIAAVG